MPDIFIAIIALYLIFFVRTVCIRSACVRFRSAHVGLVPLFAAVLADTFVFLRE